MATVKKKPQRQCTGCGEMRDKADLIRVIRTPEEKIEVDFTGKKNGRGAYLCNNPDCLAKARKRKSLERSLKMAIPPEVYERISEEMM